MRAIIIRGSDLSRVVSGAARIQRGAGVIMYIPLGRIQAGGLAVAPAWSRIASQYFRRKGRFEIHFARLRARVAGRPVE